MKLVDTYVQPNIKSLLEKNLCAVKIPQMNGSAILIKLGSKLQAKCIEILNVNKN